MYRMFRKKFDQSLKNNFKNFSKYQIQNPSLLNIKVLPKIIFRICIMPINYI